MKPKIYLLSLGCARNLVDSEVLLGALQSRGYPLTDDASRADYLILNTCGFIESAKQESIEAIFELVDIKEKQKRKPYKKLIVTGCLSQRYHVSLKKDIPQIDALFGSSDFMKIPDFIKSSFFEKKTYVSNKPSFLYDHSYARTLITPKYYAYVKIQEGCVNNCSYCVIPALRGRYRSRSIKSVIKEIELLSREPHLKEINLIGQDSTLFGFDRYKTKMIDKLMFKANEVMRGKWLRLLYAHPAHIDEKLIDVIAECENIVKYIDIPIQHISDKILKRMNRKTSKKNILKLINTLRKKIPGVIIRTSLIIGFPGETDSDFKQLCGFINDTMFEKLGVFLYSREKGTPAYKFRHQLTREIKEQRFDEIMRIQQAISARHNASYLNRIFKVLIESKSPDEKDVYIGRTYMDAPEVDGVCYVKTKKRLVAGAFCDVKITDSLEYDLVGEPA